MANGEWGIANIKSACFAIVSILSFLAMRRNGRVF
jgi:hypothetical protein